MHGLLRCPPERLPLDDFLDDALPAFRAWEESMLDFLPASPVYACFFVSSSACICSRFSRFA